MSTSIKTYTELSKLKTFTQRFNYLKVNGKVGEDTFGYDRYINQLFYKSEEWRSLRDRIIVRDNGCDLGLKNHEIEGRIIIHHMNSITKDDIINRSDILLNPEYLISVSDFTHKAIHYSDESILPSINPERKPNDTCPWRH